MRVLSCLLFCLAFLSTTSAQTNITLTDALREGLITMNITAKGGHSGESLAIRFERTGKKTVKFTIPAGQQFLPVDSTLQTLICVQEEFVSLQGSSGLIPIFALCAEANDGSPSTDMAFSIGKVAEGALLQVSEFISKNKLKGHPDAQSAIWAVTNELPVANISHPGLLTATCLALGKPKPGYRIVQDKPRPAVARQPALAYKPLRVEGEFMYQSNTEKVLNAYVVNASGEKVRVIFKDYTHKSGFAQYSFMFETSRLPRGNYEVHLHDGEKVVKTIQVVY